MPLSGASSPSISRSSVDLPAPFGPMRPMRSPRMMRRSKVAHDRRARRTRLVTSFELGHELAGALAGVERQLDVAACVRAAPRAAARSVLEPSHAAFVARAARLDALADPRLFLRPELVELAVRRRFGGELVALARFVRGEVAGIGAQHAAIELDDARGHAVEERAVVRDDDRVGLLRAAAPRAARCRRCRDGWSARRAAAGRAASANASASAPRLRSPPEQRCRVARSRRGRTDAGIRSDARFDAPALAIVVRSWLDVAARGTGSRAACAAGRKLRLLLDERDAQAVARSAVRRRRA